jgi:hypothetical protein
MSGRHQLFWCSEKNGNFTAERHADFNVKRAAEWETHTVRPGWIGEGRITRLRIDPPDGLRGTFELKSVRVFADGEARGIDTRKVTGVVFDAASPARPAGAHATSAPARRAAAIMARDLLAHLMRGP